MPDFLTLDDVDFPSKRVLVRSDLNVPIDDGQVTDDFRIRAALGTIRRLREAGARVVVASHLGRPKGVDPGFSLRPVAERLAELGGFDVEMLGAVVGAEVEDALVGAGPGSVALLENTRFEVGETENDPELAGALADLCDLFVQDAFGSVHRAHASTVGVAERVLSVAGPLLVAEVEALGRFLGSPDRPYVVVLGGAKVSDKLGVIRNLLPKVDEMLIGGGMCFTLMAAAGLQVGDSMVEEDRLEEISSVLADDAADKIRLPEDLVVADRFAEDADHRVIEAGALEAGWMGLDIGPATRRAFGAAIGDASTVFWNGPMGVFEWEPFRAGTAAVAEAMAATDAYTAVGGGDSAAALRLLGLDDRVSHLSTGGGAGLELLEGKDLPGITVLARWVGEV